MDSVFIDRVTPTKNLLLRLPKLYRLAILLMNAPTLLVHRMGPPFMGAGRRTCFCPGRRSSSVLLLRVPRDRSSSRWRRGRPRRGGRRSPAACLRTKGSPARLRRPVLADPRLAPNRLRAVPDDPRLQPPDPDAHFCPTGTPACRARPATASASWPSSSPPSSLPSAWAQNVGNRVLLVDRAIGIPGHPLPENEHKQPGTAYRTVRLSMEDSGSPTLPGTFPVPFPSILHPRLALDTPDPVGGYSSPAQESKGCPG